MGSTIRFAPMNRRGVFFSSRDELIYFYMEYPKLIGQAYYSMGFAFLCNLVFGRLESLARRGTWWTIYTKLGRPLFHAERYIFRIREGSHTVVCICSFSTLLFRLCNFLGKKHNTC